MDNVPPVLMPGQSSGGTSPDSRMADELHPELSALLGLAWSSPGVHCQTPGCARPAMLAVELSAAVSPFESRPGVGLCCDLASCYLAWWALADARVVDVHPLTQEVAEQVTGDEVAAA